MKTINIMLKPASSLCNMRCKYCFYADVTAARTVPSYGIMSEATVDAMLRSLAAEFTDGDRICFTFQGGEPTLADLPFFRRFIENASVLNGVTISYALQTNGLLLNDEWCEFLKENRFLVGVSLDLPTDAHDAVRLDANGNGTYKTVAESLSLLKKHGVACNVLCTLTNSAARHPKKVWNQIVHLGIDYVQFTPCLGNLNGNRTEYALTPHRFASFYTELFRYWYADYQKGKRRSIKLFDDVVNLMILGKPTSCGMNGTCQPQMVIEADGSVYPCDFYCLDEYKLGNITESTVSHLLHSPVLTAFTERPHRAPSLCQGCRYQSFCGGNCKRMQREICCTAADSFCGYQSFLNACGEELARLAETALHTYLAGKK